MKPKPLPKFDIDVANQLLVEAYNHFIDMENNLKDYYSDYKKCAICHHEEHASNCQLVFFLNRVELEMKYFYGELKKELYKLEIKEEWNDE